HVGGLPWGLYSERSFQDQQQEAPSKFANVPVDEVTWEIPLSSRVSIKRPNIVPALDLHNIHPPLDDVAHHLHDPAFTPSEHGYADESPPPSQLERSGCIPGSNDYATSF
ncbi:hypothetical protein CYMTET_25374, partial [Cymbomonas tetramitiformis]